MNKSIRSARRFTPLMLALAVLISGIALPDYSLSRAARRADRGRDSNATRLNSQSGTQDKTSTRSSKSSGGNKDDEVKPDNHTPEPRGKIAFASDRDGNFEIYVMNPDGSGQIRLTNEPGEDVQPTWSPDGLRLAFVSNRAGSNDIYIMNADGSNVLRLINNPANERTPAWSPTGQSIAFVSDQTGNDDIYTSIIPSSPAGFDLPLSPGRTLSNHPADDVDPAFSPDGSMIAFASNRDGDYEIYVTDSGGATQTRLTTSPNDDFRPAWSTGQITFQSQRTGDEDIFVIQPDGAGQGNITNNAALDMDPARTRDNTRFVFASNRDGNLEIYAGNAPGSALTRLTTNEDATDFNPAIQPLAAITSAGFTAASYTVQENAGKVTITVTRGGDISRETLIDFDTNDGTASERRDFTTAAGVLRFAPGQASKSFDVFITDDRFFEQNETFTVTLRNPTGAVFTGPSTATVTIIDNDSSPPTTNPIDEPTFFVTQHYYDFLNREPDADGLAAWVRVLTNCRAGDASCDRVTVSAAFFRSPEFQTKGFYAIRFYLVAFGRLPTYREFIRDTYRLNGATAEESIVARGEFADEFTEREEFVRTYESLSNAAYVDRVIQTTGVAFSNRDQLVADLNAGRKTRAQVLREIVESNGFAVATFNRAFVLAEYFGYLRRDPDPAGFNAWLTYLNNNPGDFRTMVNGFVNSVEYRLRFGQQ